VIIDGAQDRRKRYNEGEKGKIIQKVVSEKRRYCYGEKMRHTGMETHLHNEEVGKYEKKQRETSWKRQGE